MKKLSESGAKVAVLDIDEEGLSELTQKNKDIFCRVCDVRDPASVEKAIDVSSIGAAGNAGQSAYSGSKAAVHALTFTWAQELGPFGIRVAGIAPGFTDTSKAIGSMSEPILKGWMKKRPSGA